MSNFCITGYKFGLSFIIFFFLSLIKLVIIYVRFLRALSLDYIFIIFFFHWRFYFLKRSITLNLNILYYLFWIILNRFIDWFLIKLLFFRLGKWYFFAYFGILTFIICFFRNFFLILNFFLIMNLFLIMNFIISKFT